MVEVFEDPAPVVDDVSCHHDIVGPGAEGLVGDGALARGARRAVAEDDEPLRLARGLRGRGVRLKHRNAFEDDPVRELCSSGLSRQGRSVEYLASCLLWAYGFCATASASGGQRLHGSRSAAEDRVGTGVAHPRP